MSAEASGLSGAKEQARDKLAQARERTTEQVESRLTEQKSRAAETLSGVSQSLMLSSQHLRDQQQSNVSRVVERAAEQVDRLAHFLDEREVSEIVGEIEGFARRQPALFLGGAVAVGFVTARFLKSSSRSRQRARGDEYPRDVHGRAEERRDPERLRHDSHIPEMATRSESAWRER